MKHYANMLWLDSTDPPEKEGSPGAARGPCAQDSGVPADVESQQPDAYVLHHSKVGAIQACADSFAGRSSGPTSASDPSAPPSTFRYLPRWSLRCRSWLGGLSCRFCARIMLLFFVYTETYLLYARFSVDSNKMFVLNGS